MSENLNVFVNRLRQKEKEGKAEREKIKKSVNEAECKRLYK